MASKLALLPIDSIAPLPYRIPPWIQPSVMVCLQLRLQRGCAALPILNARLVSEQEGKAILVIFFFPYNPTPPHSDKPPRLSHLRGLDFGPFRLRLAPFGSVWLRLAPARVCFGSVSGPFRGVGWGRGGVGERGFCKGKEYH